MFLSIVYLASIAHPFILDEGSYNSSVITYKFQIMENVNITVATSMTKIDKDLAYKESDKLR